MKLLLRFYDCQQDSITLDGRDINEMSTEWIRTTVGYVSQGYFSKRTTITEPWLFSDTVENNLRSGNRNITTSQMIDACKAANAHTFIARMPQVQNIVLDNRPLGLQYSHRRRRCSTLCWRDRKISVGKNACSQSQSSLD